MCGRAMGNAYLLACMVFLLCVGVFSYELRKLCNKNYYNRPQCKDHPDGYGCRCGPGFIWNTFACVAIGLDSYLDFNDTKTLRYTLLIDKPFPELQSFTIALWLNVYENATHPGTVMSYTNGEDRNILQIVSGPQPVVRLFGKKLNSNRYLNESTWHHLAWTWDHKTKNSSVYIDGTLANSRLVNSKRIRKLATIPGGGDFVLGQTVSGDHQYDSNRSFLGATSNVNIRNKTLSAKNSNGALANSRFANSKRIPKLATIPGGGDFVPGQTVSGDHQYDSNRSFYGAISNVNIWNRTLSVKDIGDLFRDCFWMECGDAVEWSDFRSGTRGQMRMRWPAKIFNGQCFSELEAGSDCDRYCSHEIGAQCNAEILENVDWERTPAGHNASVPCPGYKPTHQNETARFMATRICHRTAENDGAWGKPILEDCIDPDLLDVKIQIQSLSSKSKFKEGDIIRLSLALENSTVGHHFDNAVDLATVIDSVGLILDAQEKTLSRYARYRQQRSYGFDRDRDKQLYPSYDDTLQVVETLASILDGLVEGTNNEAWLGARPQGGEGDEFIKGFERMLNIGAESLRFHFARGDILLDMAEINLNMSHIAFKIKMYKEETIEDIDFPEYEAIHDMQDRLVLEEPAIRNYTSSALPGYTIVSTAKINAVKILPNHDFKKRSMEDNVNSVLVSVNIHDKNIVDENFTVPLRIHLTYKNNFNISNPECVKLEHSHKKHQWNWTRSYCEVIVSTAEYVECECYQPGVYVVTTDMYDDNWDSGERPMILMATPSYIGCSLSSMMCLITCVMLIYLRTSSNTATIHKNFAVSIICSQMSFMLGIDRFHPQMLCHISAIVLHYFFLSTFSWLMNEAFNLYIVITYAAHSHGEHTEGGSQWRYYILGWVIPGAMVAAMVGAHMDNYYADDMCLIAWDHVWLFLGPVIGIIVVTMLVLIFTAKEHNESAYSKNEKTNKMIVIYSKALWTQVILLTICWSFALLSIKMRGIIIKWLYALFNSIQGAFFVVFYFFLNEEVRAVYRYSVKKKNLAKQGYEYSSAESDDEDDEDSMTQANELQEFNPSALESGGDADADEPCSSNTTSIRSRKHTGTKSKKRCNIETSSDEEEEIMIVNTVNNDTGMGQSKERRGSERGHIMITSV